MLKHLKVICGVSSAVLSIFVLASALLCDLPEIVLQATQAVGALLVWCGIMLLCRMPFSNQKRERLEAALFSLTVLLTMLGIFVGLVWLAPYWTPLLDWVKTFFSSKSLFLRVLMGAPLTVLAISAAVSFGTGLVAFLSIMAASIFGSDKDHED